MATQDNRLLDFVIVIHDPRVIERTDYDFVNVLVVVLCAGIAGADGWDDMGDWRTSRCCASTRVYEKGPLAMTRFDGFSKCWSPR
jgi:hypothetical protein